MPEYFTHPAGQGQPSSNDTGTAAIDPLAEALGTLARDLEEHDESALLLPAVVTAAIEMIPGAEEASVTLADRTRVRSQAPSGPLPLRIDALQERTGEGPCLDAAYEHRTVRISDMAGDGRWPRFAPLAAAAGAASMLSLQLYVEGDDLGALNLYSGTPGAFTDDSEHIGLLVAAHAAIALIGVRKQDQLQRAMLSRDLIGQAKGILSERFRISGERAFLLLSRVSQNQNRKLLQVADELVRHGTIEIGRTRPAAADPRRRP